MTAVEFMKLPMKERRRILAEAAALAEKEYEIDMPWTDFEAFGDTDIYDETP